MQLILACTPKMKKKPFLLLENLDDKPKIKTKPFPLKEKLAKKPLVASSSAKTPLFETNYELPTSTMHDNTIKITLSNWKQIKIEKQREAARLQLEQIKNTANLDDNMEAMRDFEKLIGCFMSYPTYTRGH